MIPQFILDNCAQTGTNEFGETVYWFETADNMGWVVYWPSSDDTLHTYRDPVEWAVTTVDNADF